MGHAIPVQLQWDGRAAVGVGSAGLELTKPGPPGWDDWSWCVPGAWGALIWP